MKSPLTSVPHKNINRFLSVAMMILVLLVVMGLALPSGAALSAPTSTSKPGTTLTLNIKAAKPVSPINIAPSAGTKSPYAGDLAWGKPAFASTYTEDGYPGNVTVGKGWRSASSTGTWWYVDLGKATNIRQIVTIQFVDANFTQAPHNNYIVSNDLKTWQIVADEVNANNSAGRGKPRLITLSATVKARYVGLYAVDWSGGWGDMGLFSVLPPEKLLKALPALATTPPAAATKPATAAATPTTPAAASTTSAVGKTITLNIKDTEPQSPINQAPFPDQRSPYEGDLAWGKPAFASTYTEDGYPGNVTVGKGWRSASSTGTWWYVDLGEPVDIEQIITIQFVDASFTKAPHNYYIVSNDLKTWHVFADEINTNNSAGRGKPRLINSLTTVNARYVGLYAADWGGGWGDMGLFAVLSPDKSVQSLPGVATTPTPSATRAPSTTAASTASVSGTGSGTAASSPLTVDSSVLPLDFKVVDAEYDAAFNWIIMVSAVPNQLHIYKPMLRSDEAIDLSQEPTCVSVSPDGKTAAVGHNNLITYIDLVNRKVLKTLTFSSDIVDIVLPNNGWIYVSSNDTPNHHLLAVQIATNRELPGDIGYRINTYKLSGDRKSLYGIAWELNYIERTDLNDPKLGIAVQRPYNLSNTLCTNLWLSDDGQRLFTACGVVWKTSKAKGEDLSDNGHVPGFDERKTIRQMVHSKATGLLLLLPGRAPSAGFSPGEDFTQLVVVGYDQLVSEGALTLPTFSGAATYGRFVFVNSGGTQYYVIVQADSKAGLSKDFGLVTGSLPSTK